MTLLDDIAEKLVEGEQEEVLGLVRQALDKGIDVNSIIDDGLAVGIRRVGELWEEGEFFLPELMQGAEVMKAAMALLTPVLEQQQVSRTGWKVVIGTVAGDIHDIGKTLVASVLVANGFDVVDLGADVPTETFVSKAKEVGAHVVAMSALLTTTMGGQKAVVELLQKEQLRDKLVVVVGGAPVNHTWAKEVGADGYASNAVEAVTLVKQLLEKKHN